MAFQMVVGLHVVDDEAYGRYREAIAPILERHGGGFPYDFLVARVLRSAADHPIDRLFAIRFGDRASRDAFFADPDYRAARARHFEGAVRGTTILSEHECP